MLVAVALTLAAAGLSGSCDSSTTSPAGGGGTATGGTGGGSTASGGSTATGGGGSTATGGGGSTATGGTGATGGSGGGDIGCGGDDGTGWDVAWQAAECELFDLVNAQRVQGATCGTTDVPPLNALEHNMLLTEAARAHAQDMAENQWFGHTDPGGQSSFDRIAASGYQGSGVAAELAMGDTAATVMSVVMASELDCNNVMHPGAVAVGIGYFEGAPNQAVPYWVLYFGG